MDFNEGWTEVYGKKFRPMLAAKFDEDSDLEKLEYPMYASPKVDGIRCVIHPMLGAVSRTLKPIPNQYVRNYLTQYGGPNYLDGELVVGDLTNPGAFNNTTSIMARDGDPDFTYWVFDHFAYPDIPYEERIDKILGYLKILQDPRIKLLPFKVVLGPLDITDFEQQCLKAGFEGICLRSINGAYKFGRSTLKQQGLIKIKRFTDEECVVVGFEELLHNQNEKLEDAFGLAKRSSHQANKVGGGMLGKLVVHSRKWGEFRIGSGFDFSLRREIWENQKDYLGQEVTFKYQSHGSKDKPRCPIFMRFRPDE